MSAPSHYRDWQIDTSQMKERGTYLLKAALWTDCEFIVGTKDNQQILKGHKLLLAMTSPVFEAMFYGEMAETGPIKICDVEPDAFQALLEYIYADKINLTSFDQACELCYCAKKYMIPHLVNQCIKYLSHGLLPRNACRAYEFAKLIEEPVLLNKCLEVIRTNTQQILNDHSFDDVEISTIVTIFDQKFLNIISELDLFNALERYVARYNQTTNTDEPELEGNSSQDGGKYPTIRNALVKIRFLTLTSQQFAEGPAVSDLLTLEEKFAILMNICSPNTSVPMPEEFSKTKSYKRCSKQILWDADFFKEGNKNYQTMTKQYFNRCSTTPSLCLPYYQ